MGTWISHLRIAEKLLSENTGFDEVAFAFGNLAPDSGIPNADWTVFDPPKQVSHFIPTGTNENEVQDLLFYRQYLQTCDRFQNPERFSFLSGYFVHLVSDRLWSEKIGKTTQKCNSELFASHSETEAWEIIKEDWYGLDQRYVRDHPDCLFWRVILEQPIPQSPLPFMKQAAFEQQMQYIRTFYSQPSANWLLDRPYPYLNETTMHRYVDDTSDCLLKVFRLLKACPPPQGLLSAIFLLPSADTAIFEPPLGD